MDKNEILNRVDHTLLNVTSTWEEIVKLCNDGIKYNVASVCIPPAYVKKVKEYVQDKLNICTVIGFPNGYMTTEAKVFETKDAIENGADEIDMVVNLGLIKDGNYKQVLDEINRIKEVCKNKILKVIIETCYLSKEEKIKMCKVVTESKADYIKTSTGFGTAGATEEDIKLFSEHIGSNIKIKAAGGIKDLETAETFIKLGASRLGTSSIVKIMNNEENLGY
ncbi:MAG: deoxyribose-phosphate aldolase [Clostridiales bacterium]|nr:deoxyribose-phosphate aldolase [Clostridiales bacterium]